MEGPQAYRDLWHVCPHCQRGGPQADAAPRLAWCTVCEITIIGGRQRNLCPHCGCECLTLACRECGGPWRPALDELERFWLRDRAR
jgi:hypothetical protein